jgi:hypothetical protein
MMQGFQNTVAECAALLSGGSEEQISLAMRILTLLHGNSTASKARPKPKKPTQ